MHSILRSLLVCVATGVAQPKVASAQSISQLTGSIELKVDATDMAHKLLVAHETLAVSAGHLQLAFPEWLPGTHSRSGEIDRLTGLHMRAGGRELAWSRSPSEPFKFEVDIPQGESSVDIDLIYVTPVGGRGRMMIDQNITEVEWQDVVLYPAGMNASDIRTHAVLKIPGDYQYASALEVNAERGMELDFKPVSLETLIDSPLISGRFF